MRSFPGAPVLRPALRDRMPRRLTCLVLAVLAAAFLAVPSATAEDEDNLRAKQRQVRGQIHKAAKDLHQSSKEVTRLAAKLAAARLDLKSARQKQRRVSGRLDKAQASTLVAKKQLKSAERKLDLAAAQVRKAKAEVSEQRQATRGTVTELTTTGDARIAALAAMLESGTLEELMIAETAGDLAVGIQYDDLQDLEAAEAKLKKQKVTVEAARDTVAKKKRQAQAHLRRTRTLYQESVRSKRNVSQLVSRTASTKRAAARAKAEDREALRRLRARERAIKRRILATAGPGSFQGDANGLLRAPVDGGYVTSSFGWRTHPIYGYRSFHNGVDFGTGSCGAALIAGHAGQVVSSYNDEVYGRRLYLNIGRVNGAIITLVYNHASGYKVGAGATVGRGDVVGWMGTTGWSTGCHLHFTVLRNGEPVDPMGYL